MGPRPRPLAKPLPRPPEWSLRPGVLQVIVSLRSLSRLSLPAPTLRLGSRRPLGGTPLRKSPNVGNPLKPISDVPPFRFILILSNTIVKFKHHNNKAFILEHSWWIISSCLSCTLGVSSLPSSYISKLDIVGLKKVFLPQIRTTWHIVSACAIAFLR